MKSNNIRLVLNASLNIILVKTVMKASPWMLHRNAYFILFSHHHRSLPYHSILIAVIKTPSQWVSSSHWAALYREAANRGFINQIQLYTQDALLIYAFHLKNL